MDMAFTLLKTKRQGLVSLLAVIKKTKFNPICDSAKQYFVGFHIRRIRRNNKQLQLRKDARRFAQTTGAPDNALISRIIQTRFSIHTQ